MKQKQLDDLTNAGAESYERWRAQLLANPEYRRVYDEEAVKMEVWLQLAEARQAEGLTWKQMAKRLGVSLAQAKRIERCGYDFCTAETLRDYLAALTDSQ